MSTWPNVDTDAPARKRKSPLPEANKVARMIRSGRTINDLAVRYGVTGDYIVHMLTSNGWDPGTGVWTGGDKKSFRQPPLSHRGDGPGQARHHVGGGDNPTVVPTTSRPFTQRAKPTGFAWPARPEGETPAPGPKPLRKNHGSKPRTFEQLREANQKRRKLSDEDLAEIERRYVHENVASTRLAQDYHVNQRTIRKALVHMGVTIRDRSAAGKVRWKNENGGAAS